MQQMKPVKMNLFRNIYFRSALNNPEMVDMPLNKTTKPNQTLKLCRRKTILLASRYLQLIILHTHTHTHTHGFLFFLKKLLLCDVSYIEKILMFMIEFLILMELFPTPV